jgi:DNA-directed RNA polymerase sigma subunit (sigma70/sigma32)
MDSDLSLINKIKDENDSESIQALIDRHSGIYIHTVNKTVSDTCLFMNKKDILSDKNYSIYSAALKYESSKNTKFSTYLANETRWKCLNLYNKNKKMIEQPIDESIKEKSSSEDFLNEIQNKELMSKIIDLAKKNSDKRIKKILDMRYSLSYNKVHSWKEISQKLNMSIQGCIDIHNKFILKIRKEITNV